MRRQRHTEETKITIVLESLRNKVGVSELCKKYGVSDATFYKWRDQFMEAGKRGLTGNLESPDADLKRKISEYEKVIGRLTVQNEILKKTFAD